MSFKQVKPLVLKALLDGTYRHEARSGISSKNLLQMGLVTNVQIHDVIAKCNGNHHESSPHHGDKSVTVHILKRDGWYIKFFYKDPNTFFISVHEIGK